MIDRVGLSRQSRRTWGVGMWRKSILLFSLLANAVSAPMVCAQRPPRGDAYGPGNALRPHWAPPDVDEQVPPVAPDVSCSLDQVLQEVGARVQTDRKSVV